MSQEYIFTCREFAIKNHSLTSVGLPAGHPASQLSRQTMGCHLFQAPNLVKRLGKIKKDYVESFSSVHRCCGGFRKPQPTCCSGLSLREAMLAASDQLAVRCSVTVSGITNSINLQHRCKKDWPVISHTALFPILNIGWHWFLPIAGNFSIDQWFVTYLLKMCLGWYESTRQFFEKPKSNSVRPRFWLALLLHPLSDRLLSVLSS
jgi:hypothetical protein